MAVPAAHEETGRPKTNAEVALAAGYGESQRYSDTMKVQPRTLAERTTRAGRIFADSVALRRRTQARNSNKLNYGHESV